MSNDLSFRYRAARADGSLELGVLDAASRETASGLLTGRGLFPMDIAEQAAERSRRARLSSADLALGLRVLASLLESGLPISRALASLDDLAPASWSALLPSIRESVREGKSLGGALISAPVEIPSLVIGVVRAGEAGSGLATAVRRSAELMEERAALRSSLVGALAYPLILATAGAASIALLAGVVLPRFARILTDLGQSLPRTTRIVLESASLMRASALPAVALAAIALVIWYRWSSTAAGKRQWHAWLLGVPLLGPARLAAATARSTAALAALLESGVPISAALHHAAGASGDAAIASRMASARERVLHGARISSALAEYSAATPTAIRLTRAGEETGRLAPMLAHAAALERERVTQMVKTAVRLIEPAMIVIFGGIIALVAAALLQALYSVRPVA